MIFTTDDNLNFPQLKHKMEEVIAWATSDANIKSKDWQAVKQKLMRLKADETHIIADFDMTMTAYWDVEANKRSMSSHGCLENWKGLDATIKKEMAQLYNTYYPIEVNDALSHEVRLKAMEEWWTKAHQFIIDSKLTRHDIKNMVEDSKIIFRPLLKEFIHLASMASMPMLVFSAGLGDVIEEILKAKEGHWNDGMAIVSNRMIFQDDRVIAFSEPTIHVLNKKEATMQEDWLHGLKIAERKSVILLGDSLGDLGMADGIHHNMRLSVGFCNFDIDARLPTYMDMFDIVLTNDTSFALLNKILEAIPAK